MFRSPHAHIRQTQVKQKKHTYKKKKKERQQQQNNKTKIEATINIPHVHTNRTPFYFAGPAHNKHNKKEIQITKTSELKNHNRCHKMNTQPQTKKMCDLEDTPRCKTSTLGG